MKTTKFGLEPL